MMRWIPLLRRSDWITVSFFLNIYFEAKYFLAPFSPPLTAAGKSPGTTFWMLEAEAVVGSCCYRRRRLWPAEEVRKGWRMTWAVALSWRRSRSSCLIRLDSTGLHLTWEYRFVGGPGDFQLSPGAEHFPFVPCHYLQVCCFERQVQFHFHASAESSTWRLWCSWPETFAYWKFSEEAAPWPRAAAAAVGVFRCWWSIWRREIDWAWRWAWG